MHWHAGEAFGVATYGLALYAQAAPTLDPTLGTLLGNLGIMGVLVWHLWYHTTHSYPKMMAQFNAEANAQREHAKGEAKELRDLFQREAREQRDLFSHEMSALREYASREQDKLQRMLIDTLQSTRSAVHDIKDTTSGLINKLNVAEVQRQKEDDRRGA